MKFLDTNILIRYFTGDDPIKAQASKSLLEKVENKKEKLATSPMVIFETVFLLEKRYKLKKVTIQSLVLPIIQLPNISLLGKNIYRRTFEFYVKYNVSFADAYNVALMEIKGIREIYSYDKDFDKIKSFARLEPEISN